MFVQMPLAHVPLLRFTSIPTMLDAPDDDWKQNGMMTVEELYTRRWRKGLF